MVMCVHVSMRNRQREWICGMCVFACVRMYLKGTSLKRPKQSTSISTLWWRILYHCDNKGSKVLCAAVKHCVILIVSTAG